MQSIPDYQQIYYKVYSRWLYSPPPEGAMGPWAPRGSALPIPGSTREEAMVDHETSLTVEPRPKAQGPWPPAGDALGEARRGIFPYSPGMSQMAPQILGDR